MDQPYNGIPARDLPGVTWRRSRRSSPNGNCVEIAAVGRESMAVRDSKDPDGPALIYSPAAIARLIEAVRIGNIRKEVP
jgi:hypothetical protein